MSSDSTSAVISASVRWRLGGWERGVEGSEGAVGVEGVLRLCVLRGGGG